MNVGSVPDNHAMTSGVSRSEGRDGWPVDPCKCSGGRQEVTNSEAVSGLSRCLRSGSDDASRFASANDDRSGGGEIPFG